MKLPRGWLIYFFQVFLLCCLCNSQVVHAQDAIHSRPYQPQSVPPEFDPQKFPEQSDSRVWEKLRETLSEFESNKDIGKEIAEKYGLRGDALKGDEYEPHPWRTDNAAFGWGRNILESQFDWFMDSLATVFDLNYWQCLEPTIVSPAAGFEYWVECTLNCWPIWGNLPVVVEYWWPEYQIETNNFAVSAYNPIMDSPPRIDLVRPVLKLLQDITLTLPVWSYLSRLSQESVESSDFPEKLRDDPHLGQTHWSGFSSTDQTYYQEAHVTRTFLSTHAAEKSQDGKTGFQESNSCFYDDFKGESIQEKKIVSGWTESFPYNLFWRIPEFSAFLDEELYSASTATGKLLQGIAAAKSTEPFVSPCLGYRIQKWPSPHQDLATALNISQVPSQSEALERICYKGGGQLFPVVGSLIGHFAPLTAEAYLARRAIELFSSDQKFGDINLMGSDESRLPRFSDKADKLQRVYPRKDGQLGTSACFRMNDIPSYVEMKSNSSFPTDLVKEEQLGSIRHIYWNKRIGCHCTQWGVRQGCYTMDYGNSDSSRPLGGLPLFFLGPAGYVLHGIPWPIIF
jgi:hypothetical protein